MHHQSGSSFLKQKMASSDLCHESNGQKGSAEQSAVFGSCKHHKRPISCASNANEATGFAEIFQFIFRYKEFEVCCPRVDLQEK